MGIKFEDLTDDEIKNICNGCGSKGGIIKPPELMFHASCNKHDYSYHLGGTEADRKRADKGFYKAMKKDAWRADTWWKCILCRRAAHIYYRAVRRFGKSSFNYLDDIEHKNKTD